jgi:hypothetical protein
MVMQGAFSPYYSMRGVENETEEFMKDKVQGLFPATTLQSWNIRTLKAERVEAGFRFEAELPAATEHNRIYLNMPGPFHEDVSRIGSVHIERSEYPVPIRLMPCRMTVTLTFDDLSGYAVFGNALNANEENGVGRVAAAVQKSAGEDDSSITLMKELTLTKAIVPSEEYGLLRSLLLGYEDNLIILEKGPDD